jgi:hypothetical protein
MLEHTIVAPPGVRFVSRGWAPLLELKRFDQPYQAREVDQRSTR